MFRVTNRPAPAVAKHRGYVMALKRWSALALCLLLPACGLANARTASNMDAQQIVIVSDSVVCNPYASGAVIESERARRGLGDCTLAHKQCVAMGYSGGTPGYLACRQMLAGQGAAAAAQQQAAWSNLGNVGLQMMRGPPPPSVTTTTCSPLGGYINCTSVGR